MKKIIISAAIAAAGAVAANAGAAASPATPAAPASEVPVASTALVGEGIALFVPQGYDPEKTPSLMLEKEPVYTGALPSSWQLNPRFTVTADGKAGAVLAVPEGTSLYGGGEVTGPLLRNGMEIELWNVDNGAYRAVDNGTHLYQTHPWVMGVRPDGTAFGILFDSSWKSHLATKDNEIRFDTEGAPFRAFVIDRATPQDVVRGLAELTGTIEMPPLWSLGYHQCRFSYMSQDRVREIAQNFRQHQIPCDVIWMDIDYMDGYRIFTFDPVRFSDPKALNDDLHKAGFKAVYMIDPAPKADPNYFVYKSGTENDVWVRTADGKEYQGNVWPGMAAFPDFTSPDVRRWWSDLYKDFLSTGVDGVWNDVNEPAVFDNNLPEDERTGTMPVTNLHRGGGKLPAGPHLLYHNAYGRFMVEGTRDGFLKVYPDKRPFVLTRSNILGGQRYAATWTGDNYAEPLHMKWSVPMSLTLGLSGQPYSGPDIGGFLGNTSPELFADWIGFGTFLPFARGHACAGTNDKEPWAFGPEVEKVSRMALERRYRLLPYLYTCYHTTHETGLPVMQPLFFADPKDPALRAEDQAFTMGENLLVIPSFAENPALPKGIWEKISLIPGDLKDKHQATLLLKGGAIIPAGKVIQNTEEATLEPLTLYVCLDENGKAEGQLYWDAGNGWEFRAGDYSLMTFRAARDGKKVKVTLDSTEGKRDVASEIKNLEVVLVQDGKTRHAKGTLADGVTLSVPAPKK